MMVVETSALMAILLMEPEGQIFEEAIYQSSASFAAAPTLLEFHMAASSRKHAADRHPETVLANLGLQIVAWSEQHLDIAKAAFTRFGKGSGHPARLNFGDCMSYALAKALDAPLLYKGEDFAMTDIRSAL